MLIFGFIVVIFIVMMRAITAATERHAAHKERMAALKHGGGSGGLDAAAAARIENMEQRLRVLERIATDSGANVSAELAREIEALRTADDAGAGIPLALKEKVQ